MSVFCGLIHLLFLVVHFQTVQGSPQWSPGFPVLSYVSPSNEVASSVGGRQQSEERSVMNDVKQEDNEDVSTSFISSQIRNQSHGVLTRIADAQQHMENGERINDRYYTDWIQSNSTYQNTQAADRSNKCDVCRKTLTNAHNLRNHKEIHIRPKKKESLQCDICQKIFKEPCTLRSHLTVHSRSFPCDICSRSFNWASTLKSHKVRHTDVKSYICDLCNKAFSTIDGLTKHEDVHLGFRRFSCDICDKSFKYSGGLKEHKRMHAGEKPYACSVCGRAYARSGSLKMHRYTHDAVKPYHCSVCKKQFNWRSGLLVHEKKCSSLSSTVTSTLPAFTPYESGGTNASS